MKEETASPLLLVAVLFLITEFRIFKWLIFSIRIAPPLIPDPFINANKSITNNETVSVIEKMPFVPPPDTNKVSLLL